MSDFDFDAQLEAVKNEFIEKSFQDLDAWETLIIKLRDHSTRLETFKKMIREIHSLKGSSGTYGLEFVTKICHKFEEKLLACMNKGIENVNEQSVDSFLKFIDTIKQIFEIEQKEKSSEQKEQKYIEIWQSLLDEGSQSTVRILLVSPTKLYSNLIKSHPLLVQSNLNIVFDVFSSGYIALGEVLRFPYKVIIADNQLLHINGQELIAMIKLKKAINSYCILLSSSQLPQQEQKSLAPDLALMKNKENLELVIKKIVEVCAK